MQELVFSAIVIVVALAVPILLLWAFYQRPSKDIAYVRTGMFGQKVIVNEGGIVLPIVHDVMPVNRKTIRVEIERDNKAGLITKDSLRVDVIAEIFLRVGEERDAIATAARTLGQRTLEKQGMKEFLEAQCVAALRSVAASMDLEELHQNRPEFEHRVHETLNVEFQKNGLELVTVSLKRLDQTDKEYFDPTNTFDAKGLVKLDKIAEESKKRRNEIEQDTQTNIERKNMEATKHRLKIEQDEIAAQKDQEKVVAQLKEEAEREIERIQFENETEVERLRKEMKVRLATFEQETLNAWIEADKTNAEAARIKELIATAREKAEAERDKLLEVISAEKEAKRQTIIATANADVEKLAAAAAKVRYEVEAAGKSALNNASNLLSNDQINMQVKMEIVRQLPQIISESVKPIENIDGIKIMHLDGLANATGGGSGSGGNGGTVASAGSGGGGGDSLADQVVNSALRYRAQSPLVESLLNEVGLKGSGINDFTRQLKEDMQSETPVPVPAAVETGTPAPEHDVAERQTDEEPPTDTKH